MQQTGSKRVVGIAMLATAVLMFVLAVLFWTGVLGVAPESRMLLAAALGLAGLVDIGVGVKFLQAGGSE